MYIHARGGEAAESVPCRVVSVDVVDSEDVYYTIADAHGSERQVPRESLEEIPWGGSTHSTRRSTSHVRETPHNPNVLHEINDTLAPEN